MFYILRIYLLINIIAIKLVSNSSGFVHNTGVVSNQPTMDNDANCTIPLTQVPFDNNSQSAYHPIAPHNHNIAVAITVVLLEQQPLAFVTTSELPMSAIATSPNLPLRQSHPMIARAKARIYKPHVFLSSLEPFSIKEAFKDPMWLKAIEEEYKSLMENNT